MRAAFLNLKSNAKRRGIPFTISFDYFKKFCYKTDYIAGKGRRSDGFSIDRINNDKGYIPGNLQVLSFIDNCKKGVKKMLVYDWRTKYGTVIKTLSSQNTEDNPF